MKNKISLCTFLTEALGEIGKQQLQTNKELIIDGALRNGELALSIKRENSDVLPELNSDHEEADAS